MVFQTKKISSETLGEYLKAVRTTFNLSLEEAAEGAKVNVKLLGVLESGKVNDLPADVYVRGILNRLAVFYSLEEDLLLEQYKKERQIAGRVSGRATASAGRLSDFWKKLVITPKVIVIVLAGAFILFSLAYLLWQVSSINRAPQLVITSPSDRAVLDSLSVEVQGKTDAGVAVSVNDQEIFVDNNGKFDAQISLVPGSQEINVVAKNRFGKQTKQSVKVFPKNPSKTTSVLNLKLRFSADAELNYSIDGQPEEKKNYKTGDEVSLSGQAVITLSSPDGGALSGNLNGQELGRLGKSGEPLDHLTFSAESANIK